MSLDIMSSRPSSNYTGPTTGHYSNGYCASHSPVSARRKSVMATGSEMPLSNGSDKDACGPSKKMQNGYEFLGDVFELIVKDALIEANKEENKVLEFVHPAELEKRIDLSLSANGRPKNDLLASCKDIIRYSVKTGHPHFFNQLFGGVDVHALAGAWLADSINTSQYTYEVAPVFTMMEKTVFSKMLGIVGFKNGDAIFCPGGSASNMYAISLARYHTFPEVKQKGLFGLPPLAILTSEKSHYSIRKGASFLGFGMDNVIPVKCTEFGKIIPEALEESIQQCKDQGMIPLMVVATAGSTVFGTYDPLHPIADICQRHKLWMHVDAAWGGGVLLSKKYRHLVDGIDRADSVTWNPHKMMGALQQCSCFLTRHPTLLAECHSANATYLFQQDKFYDVSYDTGDKSMQCGRKVDVMRLWLMWRAKGDVGFERDIDNIMDLSRYLADRVRRTEGFRLVMENPECTNVTFYYIPASMRGQEETPEWWNTLSKVAPAIKKQMMEDGTMLVGYQPEKTRVNFFRMVICNHKCTQKDMDFVIQEIDRIGKNM